MYFNLYFKDVLMYTDIQMKLYILPMNHVIVPFRKIIYYYS